MNLFLLIATLLLQAPSPRGSVTGTVIVAGTSAPIANAEVAILTSEGLLEATTDASGRFALASVPSGRQTVLIRADGFFVEPATPNTPFPQRAEIPVNVAPGSAAAIPNVAMVQSGTIIGKVVDPQGKPVPFVRVQALRPGVALNSGVLPEFAWRLTDDRGEYRMFWVPPGEYVIRAFLQEGRPVEPMIGPPVTGEIRRLVSTLFPNTTDTAQASKVTVKSGEEVSGIDISVKVESIVLPPPPKVTSVTPGFKVSGVVIDGLLPIVGTGAIMLGSEAEASPPRVVGTVIIGETPGAFEIPSVPPGKYDLFVRMEHPRGSPGAGGAVQAWGRATIEVRDSDVADVRMVIHPSMDVPGVVKIDGKNGPGGGTLRIGLQASGTAGRLGNYRGILDRAQTPNAEGRFTIPAAAEGNYDVFIQGVPENYYVADIRQADTSILVSGIAVRNAPPAPFEVVISSDGGTVEGIVSNADKTPTSGATVLLVPADPQLLRLYKTATAGPDGKYSFHGVRPGEYKVFAGPPGLSPAGGLTPELLSRVDPKGVGVTVKTATSATANLGLITD